MNPLLGDWRHFGISLEISDLLFTQALLDGLEGGATDYLCRTTALGFTILCDNGPSARCSAEANRQRHAAALPARCLISPCRCTQHQNSGRIHFAITHHRLPRLNRTTPPLVAN